MLEFLFQQHLDFLIDVLRDYITDKNKDAMETSLNKVKDEFNSNMVAVDHLQLALCSFNDAVRTKQLARL